MRALLSCVILSTCGLASGAAPVATQTDAAAADLAARAVLSAFERRPVEPVSTLYLTLGFFLDFPDDPRALRRLSNIVWLDQIPEMHERSAALPEADRAAYQALLAKELASALARPDLPAKSRELLTSFDLQREMRTQQQAQTPDPARVRVLLDNVRAHFPAVYEPSDEVLYADLLAKVDAAAAQTYLRQVAAGADARAAVLAQGALNIRQARIEPMQMKFTALDGRKVDLRKLRGKVVLVDFWSTHCGPCIAEFPNIKNVYRDYQARGFEVIGISLDEQSDEKALRRLVAEKELPWPQHFDGKGANNVYAAKYGIYQIPAPFLLDRNGLLVSTNARGERLATQVQQFLAEKPARK